MPDYRRIRKGGCTYFFTVALADRGTDLLVDRIADLRRAYAVTVSEHPLRCDAMVILPDHLHAVWTLPEGDSDYPQRWRKLKARFSRAVGKMGPRTPSKIAKRERGVWQRRHWEHLIRDEADFRSHMAYCWSNPVKHGLVADALDWPFSSIHRDMRRGWAVQVWPESARDGSFGE